MYIENEIFIVERQIDPRIDHIFRGLGSGIRRQPWPASPVAPGAAALGARLSSHAWRLRACAGDPSSIYIHVHTCIYVYICM